MIACIWDFNGINSLEIAKHFEKHIKEFILIKNIHNIKTGYQSKNIHSFVWCVSNKENLTLIIELLKPKYFLAQENFKDFGILIT